MYFMLILEAKFLTKMLKYYLFAVQPDLFFRNGAVYYAIVKMEFYKQKAWEAFKKAESAGAARAQLRLFLVLRD